MFDVQDIIEKYLGSSSSYQRKSEPDERHYFCPKCNWKNPRLSVDYGKNVFHCWYCNWGGHSLSNILYEVNAEYNDIKQVKEILGERAHEEKTKTTLSEIKARLQESISPNITTKKEFHKRQNKKIVIDKWDKKVTYKPLSEGKDFMAKVAKRYLRRDRGLSNFEIKYYDFYYATDSILIPNYDEYGKMNYWVRRSLGGMYDIPDKSEVKKSEIIFFEHLIDWSQPIILCEGIFDAIKIGFNAVPLLGTFINKEIVKKIIKNKTPLVYVWLDTEAYKNSVELGEYLKSYDIKVVNVVKYGYKDPGDVPKNEIPFILENNIEQIDKYNLKIKI